jgi:hypothetical protein
MKKIYWIIITGTLVIALVVMMQVLKGNKPTEVYIEKAEVRDIIEIVSAAGNRIKNKQ